MKLHKVFKPMLLLFVLMFSGAAYSQGAMFGINGGAAQLFGQNFDNYKVGYDLGLSFFASFDDNSHFGLRVGYNNYSPESGEFLEDIIGLENGTVEGSAWSIDILPVLRFSTDWNFPANLFSEVGAGVTILNTNLDITGTIDGTPVNVSTGQDTDVNFLTAFSLGLSVGFKNYFVVDLYPTLNTAFINGNNLWVYSTYNIGVMFIF